MVLSEEHKAKMKAGRQRAAAERKAKGITKSPRRRTIMHEKLAESGVLDVPKQWLAKGHRSVDPPILTEFLGITKTDCPVGCTVNRCIITEREVCGHPEKGSMQPALMANRDAVERYNRARNHLAHVELDKRDKQRP